MIQFKNASEQAPCRQACPAGIDVPRYVRLVCDGKFADALAVIREKIPFPSVCGRVCPHPCEAKCRLSEIEEPVAIRALKRFVAEQATAADAPSLASGKRTGKRVAVIGSGPAGLTAAYYLSKIGRHSVVVYEASPKLGGTMRACIPKYRLPAHVLDAEIESIMKVGVEIKTNSRVDLVDDLFKQGYGAVFLATGTQRGLKLGIEGEEQAGVMDAVTFLKEVNLGRKPSVGQRALVIGGGNAAIDAARTALRLGARKVTIVYRRSRAEMPASAEEVEEALREGVEIIYLAAPSRVTRVGEAMSLECLRTELGLPDANGRRSAKPIPGMEFSIEADTVIAAIGQAPETGMGMGLALNNNGLLSVNSDTLETSRPGVFAGGDAVTGPASVIEAIAAGRKAAIATDKYLGESGSIEELLAPVEGTISPLRSALPVGDRVAGSSLPIGERVKEFAEVEFGLGKDQAIRQAMRCLRCDLPITVDASKCTGCLTCELRCSFGRSKEFNLSRARISVRRVAKREVEYDVALADECDACGICARYCPYGALAKERRATV